MNNNQTIDEILATTFKDYKSTFKETSFDKDNSVYLCSDSSTSNAYDFDRYVSDMKHKKTHASPDAIHIRGEKVYFIEFKNQSARQIDNRSIKDKFESGMKILETLLPNGVSKASYQYIFCVVYRDPIIQKKEKKTPQSYSAKISSGIKANVIRFGLEEKNIALNNFYDKIITEKISFYKDAFTQLQCS